MKWKKGVMVTRMKQQKNTGYRLQLMEKQKEVRSEHRYLLEAVLHGIEDDRELIAYIMKKEHMDEVPASFELAGFLIEYAEFIAEDTTHYDIVG